MSVVSVSTIGRLPTAEPIESKLVNMLWPNEDQALATMTIRRLKNTIAGDKFELF